MSTSRSARGRLVAVLLTSALAASASAADWTWSGGCANDAWWSVCAGDECTPGHPLLWNNWGQAVCHPLQPSFPGSTDNVHFAGPATLDWANATAQNVYLYPGGLLTVKNGANLTVIGSLIHNDGQLWLKYGGIAGDGVLTVSGSVLLSGSGALRSAGGVIEGGGTLSVAQDQTVSGAALRIQSALSNAGTIIADAGTVTLSHAPKTNMSIMKTALGGILDLSTGVVQTATGEIRADGGTVRLLGGAAIQGGSLHTESGGAVIVDNTSATLTDVANHGVLKVGNGAVLHIWDALTNEGELHVHYGGSSGDGQLQFANNLTVGGSGHVRLSGGRLDSATGALVTIGPDQLVHGSLGYIDVAIDNLGRIAADVPGGSLALRAAPKTNRNRIEAGPGTYLDISTLVTQFDDGRILADGGTVRFFGGSIVGGALDTQSGGQMVADYYSVSIQDLTNRGTLRVGNGAHATMRGALANDGVITLFYGGLAGNGHARLDGDVVLSGSGALNLEAGDVTSLNGGTLTNAGAHTITGTGPVHVALTSAGVVAPGSGVGTLTCTGSYTQTPSGTLSIELLGTSQYDRLVVSGAASLRGTVDLVAGGGFTPQPGHQFVVLTAGSLSGQFDDVRGPGRFVASYAGNQVTLTVVNQIGDVNCDGAVTFDDIDPFVVALGGEAAYLAAYPNCSWLLADTDCDGDVDFDDIDPMVACLSGNCSCGEGR